MAKKNQLPLWMRLAVKLLRKIHNPVIPEEPKPGKWYRVPMEGYVASDGSPYQFSFRKGTENKLIVFLNGGGVSWNAYMAARSMSVDAEDVSDCYYFPQAGEYGTISGGHGILSEKEHCPFRTWSVINLPYCTGDFHCGTADFPYIGLDGTNRVLHHHGYTNLLAAVGKAMRWTGAKPEQLLVTGNSAGGFGTALMTDAVMGLFPECEDATCLVDSGLMYMEGWQAIARDVWKAPEAIWQRMYSDCFTLDCLEALKNDHGDKVKVLLACSVRDLNLAQLVGFPRTGKLYADETLGKEFQQQLKHGCKYMLDRIPGAAVYIFDTPVDDPEGRAMGLTRHCIIPDDVAFTIRVEDTTVVQWLMDAMSGNGKSIGLRLLDQ